MSKSNSNSKNMSSNRTRKNSNISSLRSSNNSSTNTDPWSALEEDLGGGGDTLSPLQIQAKVRNELAKARSNGRLSLKDAGLTSPLPAAMFDLRSGPGSEVGKSWESYGEETLISLDLSENDLSAINQEQVDIYARVSNSNSNNNNGKNKVNNTNTNTNSTKATKDKDPQYSARSKPRRTPPKSKPVTPQPLILTVPGMLDERIGCYVSLRTLRVKRCKLTKLPWTIILNELTSLVILDVSDNDFDAFHLECMPASLSTLDISRNKISTLTFASRHNDQHHDQLIDLPNLTHFDANSNQLTQLPPNIHAPILQHLFLSQNKLVTLSKPTTTTTTTSSSSSSSSSTTSKTLLDSCVDNLQTLYAPENCLRYSPNLERHSKLTVVELRMNQLTTPPAIHGNLIRLDLNNNKIESLEGLYPILDKYPTAKFDVTADEITSDMYKGNIEGTWFRTNMKELHLQTNCLTPTIHDATLSVMTKLKFIDVSHNDLDKVPIVLGYLPDVRRISLDGNPLRMIRHAVKYAEDGSVDTNKLKQSMRMKGMPPPGPGYLPHEAGGGYGEGKPNSPEKRMATTAAKTLVKNAVYGECKLDMSGSDYSGALSATEVMNALTDEVRETASTMTKSGNLVASWDVSNSKITSFGPEWIDALKNISMLDAHQNGLKTLPDNLHQLTLRTLFFGRNQLTSMEVERTIFIHPASELVKNIQHLDLSANKLEWVPSGLFDMYSLRTLNLSHNKIKDLKWKTSVDLGVRGEVEGVAVNRGWKHGLATLIQLDLSNNQITDLGFMPLALSGCKSLRILQLNNNNLEEVPYELGLLKQLTTINLAGNPQNMVRTNILSESCEYILEYLFNKMDSDEVARVEKQHRAIETALMSSTPNNGREGAKDTTENGRIAVVKNSNKPTSELFDAQASTAATISDEERRAQKEELVKELKIKVTDLEVQLEKISISEMKRNNLKKDLALSRSQLNREEKQLIAQSS